MITIPLTQGKVALVDDIDADLTQMKWHYGNGYARRHNLKVDCLAGASHTLFLHRLIFERKLGRPLLPHEKVDHRDLNGLNNQRDNLRLATQAQNMKNVRKRQSSNRPYKGIEYRESIGKWRVMITVDGHNRHLGYYQTAEEAAIIYNEAAKQYYGEFACLNEGLPDIQVKSTAFQITPVHNTSGFRGVTFHAGMHRWMAQIQYQQKHFTLGYYETPRQAARVYNIVALCLHGSKARLNLL